MLKKYALLLVLFLQQFSLLAHTPYFVGGFLWGTHLFYEGYQASKGLYRSAPKKKQPDNKKYIQKIVKKMNWKRLLGSLGIIGVVSLFLQKKGQKLTCEVLTGARASQSQLINGDGNAKNVEKIAVVTEEEIAQQKVEKFESQVQDHEDQRQKQESEQVVEVQEEEKIDSEAEAILQKREPLFDGQKSDTSFVGEQENQEGSDASFSNVRREKMDQLFIRMQSMFGGNVKGNYSGRFCYLRQSGGPNDRAGIGRLFNEDVEGFTQEAIDLLRTKTEQYKIHVMPVDMIDFLDKLCMCLEEFPNMCKEIVNIKFQYNKEIGLPAEYYIDESGVVSYKFPLLDAYGEECDPLDRNNCLLPLVVMYVSANNVQDVLNNLHSYFKKQVCKGLNICPRYNAQVTDLLYFAQGNADDKAFFWGYTKERGPFRINSSLYFEQPDRVYFSKKVAEVIGKKQEDFFLLHPETGEYVTMG